MLQITKIKTYMKIFFFKINFKLSINKIMHFQLFFYKPLLKAKYSIFSPFLFFKL